MGCLFEESGTLLRFEDVFGGGDVIPLPFTDIAAAAVGT